MYINEIVKNRVRCGAKNRKGLPCKRVPCRGKKRCSLHGGKSPYGIASPHYTHGLYAQGITGIVARGLLARQKAVEKATEKAKRRMETLRQDYEALVDADTTRPRKRGRPRKQLTLGEYARLRGC